MTSIFTISIVQTALELGGIYALVALALFVSFRILNIADLSTDGCFTLGCAVCSMVTLTGHPILALFMAMLAGVCSGFITSVLQTRFGIESILAGIIVNTGLYTINLMVMGFSSNVNLFKCDTIFSMAKEISSSGWVESIVIFVIILLVAVILALFLGTRLGLSIRATGNNEAMVRSSSINPHHMIVIGLCISGSLTALSGGVLAQYQKSCDINLGTGMVTIALASLIIGETIFGRGSIGRNIVGVICGSVLYRFIIAVALRLSLPAEALKLVSALIVAIALALPYMRQQIKLFRTKKQSQRENEEIKTGGKGTC